MAKKKKTNPAKKGEDTETEILRKEIEKLRQKLEQTEKEKSVLEKSTNRDEGIPRVNKVRHTYLNEVLPAWEKAKAEERRLFKNKESLYNYLYQFGRNYEKAHDLKRGTCSVSRILEKGIRAFP